MDVRRTDIDGVPVFWTESSMPFVAYLLIRMGRVDETLLTSGLSHLLEHVVLSTEWPADEFNATVTPLVTQFWFGGEQASATDRLTQTLAAISEPPLPRIPREREILRTEEYGRGRSEYGTHSALRFGPLGIGLSNFREHGLQRATYNVVRDWFGRFGVNGNVAIGMTRPPRDDLRLLLPDGPRVQAPTPQPLPFLTYPLSFAQGADGSAGMSMLVRRTHATVVGLEILTHRLRQWLRHREGVTYHVGSTYDALTPDLAQLVVWADCRPESAEFARNAIVAAADELATAGPAEDELEQAIQEAVRRIESPEGVYENIHYAAAQYLDGEPDATLEDVLEGRRALTPSLVAEEFAYGFESLIVSAPHGTPQLGGRFAPYPLEPRIAITGRRYSPVDKERKDTLVVGTEGVAIEGPVRRAVAFADAAAFLTWDDGSVGLYGTDGDYVLVDPADWKKGERAAADVAMHVDEGRAIDVSSVPHPFEAADLLEGAAAFAEEHWELARIKLQSGLELEPTNAEAWSMLAWASAKLSAPDAAISAGRKAVEFDRTDVWSARFVAEQLLQAGHGREAVDAAREALRRGPVDLSVLTLVADVLAKAGHLEEAQRIGRRATELFPGDSSAWFAYGWSAKAASDWGVAEDALRKAVEIDPEIAMWHNNLGTVLLEVGRPKEALAAFDRALELNGSSDFAHKNRALALLRLGKAKEAHKVFRAQAAREVEAAQAAVASAPGDLLVLERLTRALLAAERDPEALQHARALVEQEPTASRYDLLAAALDWLGELDEAVAACDAGLAIDPEHQDLLAERVWLAAVLGDAEAARAATGRIERAGAPVRTLSAQAMTAVASEDWGGAIALYDELISLRPLNCCAVAWRGVAQLGRGDENEARAAVREAESMAPTRCGSLRHLQARLGALAPA